LAATGEATWITAEVGDLAPFVAEVEASIETGPVIDGRERVIVRAAAAVPAAVAAATTVARNFVFILPSTQIRSRCDRFAKY